jgi:hypothetical protein
LGHLNHQLPLQQHLHPQQLTPELLQAILNLEQQQQSHQQPGPKAAGGQGLAAIADPTLPTAPPNTALPTPKETPISVPLPFGRDGQAESFPAKLYRLMAEVERAGNTHIVSFTPNGRAFQIHDESAFMTEVAPAFFSQTKFTSFRRQLSFYGFERLSVGPDRGAFSHDSFLRGLPELLHGVRRQIILAPRAKKTSS